jgi:YggT family protein
MAVADLITDALDIYILLIVVWIVTSWMPAVRARPGFRQLGAITEPFLKLFRFIPPIGGVDFSPVAAIVALMLIKRLIGGGTM